MSLAQNFVYASLHSIGQNAFNIVHTIHVRRWASLMFTNAVVNRSTGLFPVNVNGVVI